MVSGLIALRVSVHACTGPSQLCCLGSSAGKSALSGVQSVVGSNPTRGAFFLALGVLCCFALFVCLPLLASFFLPSLISR